MLMLTHTYLLQNFFRATGINNYDLDVFVYNILPDLLPINPCINSQQTHKIKRLWQNQPLYPKVAYIMFHLLVDDLAHYGLICSGIPDDFNPDSQGYSYIKGKPLINSILGWQKNINKEISYSEAAYRSHLIVEMIYDLVIIDHINNNRTIDLLADAVGMVADRKNDEFIATVNWLYGMNEENVCEVLKRAGSYVTKEKMQKIMNIEGRIRLYSYRFGLENDHQLYYEDIKNIFTRARELLDDGEVFLRVTAEAVKDQGWMPVLVKQPSLQSQNECNECIP